MAIIHPTTPSGGIWIDDFVEPVSPYRFQKFGPDGNGANWHKRGRTTTRSEWRRHFRQAWRAMRSRPDVVVASFPPLIFASCVLKALMLSRARIIGWSFNFGGGSKSRLAAVYGRAFSRASVLVTHSRAEIPTYARAFGLPAEKFCFVPFQQGDLHEQPAAEQFDLVAMGSAGRDYATLFAALHGTGLRALVIAKPEAVAGLDIPENVEVRTGLTLPECRSLSLAAPISVVPVAELDNAAGQVTFLIAMAQGRAIVATRCTGTSDYLTDGVDSLLVEPQDPSALRAALLRLAGDDDLRRSLSAGAQENWRRNFSDQAAGQNLRDLLDRVTGHE